MFQISHNNLSGNTIPIAPVFTELNLGGHETLFDNIRIENLGFNRLIIAAGGVQRPIDIMLYDKSEELSFRTIYVR